MKLRSLRASLFLSLACLSPSAVWAGEVHEFTLDNGLKLLIKEDHRAPVVVSQVWYKIGSSYEQEGKTGITHLLEHMMFKGTPLYPAGEFSRIMAANGAEENAFTGLDYTAYFQTLEKSRLSVSFELEADRMRHLLLQEDEFQKERDVVLEERRMRTEDKPNALTYEYFLATAFQTSPYRNPIIGWKSDLENLNLADLNAWYQQWYAPNNAILVVVGDVDPQAVRELAQQYFGPLPPSSAAAMTPRPEVTQTGDKRLTIKRPAKLPYLLMGYKVPSLSTISEENAWEVYALDVLSGILDGGDSARLSKHLVRGAEIASSISASYDLYSRLSELFIFGGIPAQGRDVPTLEAALREQIERVRTEAVTQAELDRIKAQLVAAKVYELDSVFYQAMQLGSLAVIGLDWRLKDQYLERIAAISPAQVQAVAQKYLIDDGLTVAVLEPQPLPDNADIVQTPHDSHAGAIP